MRLTQVLGLACVVVVVTLATVDSSTAIQDSLQAVAAGHHGADRPDNPWRELLGLPVAALLGAALAFRPVRRGTPARDPAVRPPILGRSCHDAAELAHATGEGCDYVTLSPVFPSPSKPGYGPALGPDRFGALCARAGLPVYALGGITTAAQAAACRAAGAHGVAVMGAVMRADDPAAAVKELLP